MLQRVVRQTNALQSKSIDGRCDRCSSLSQRTGALTDRCVGYSPRSFVYCRIDTHARTSTHAQAHTHTHPPTSTHIYTHTRAQRPSLNVTLLLLLSSGNGGVAPESDGRAGGAEEAAADGPRAFAAEVSQSGRMGVGIAPYNHRLSL